jgi:hypothetical protein
VKPRDLFRGRYLICEKCSALYDFDALPSLIQEMILATQPARCGKSKRGKICDGKLVGIYSPDMGIKGRAY